MALAFSLKERGGRLRSRREEREGELREGTRLRALRSQHRSPATTAHGTFDQPTGVPRS